VQVTKRALRKYVEIASHASDWDEWLPWLAMGYRCSAQKSTGFSPFYLLHGAHPIVPPNVADKFEAPLDFEDPDRIERVMLIREEAIQTATAAAGGNLRIAQHRAKEQHP
jgi:hypothetical protein